MKTLSLSPAPAAAGGQVTVSGPQRYGVISSVTAGELDFTSNNGGLGAIADENGAVSLIVNSPGFGTISSMVSGISNIAVVAAREAYEYTPTLDDAVELLPDTLAIYIGYRIMAKIFSMDGECKDDLRRRYCQARYDEGLSLAQAIAEEEMEEQDA
jgi:hypothetical protein